MARALINATNVVGSGAKALALSLMPELCDVLSSHKLHLLLPDIPEFKNICSSGDAAVQFFPRGTGMRNNYLRMRELYLDIPRIAKLINADVCLSLGDVGCGTLNCPEIVFLQNAHFVYDNTELGDQVTWGILKRVFLKWQMRRTIRCSATMIVQTPVMRERLLKRYSISKERVHVISQPTPSHVLRYAHGLELNETMNRAAGKQKLLFLAQYYPHKNHAILKGVCNELVRRGLEDSVRIFVTLEQAEWNVVRDLCPDTSVLENLGRLRPAEVAAALRTSDALFLPSLVESYGLVYLEALMLDRPVLASDRDFAHHISDEFALFFDPMNPSTIVDCVQALPKFQADWYKKAEALRRHLSSFPSSWKAVAMEFRSVIEAVLAQNNKHAGPQ